MTSTPSSPQDRLAPFEEIFFTWLARVIVAAALVGCAWIDDAPPLELAARVIAIYVAIRVVTQFGALFSSAPSDNRVLKAVFATVAILLLGLSFPSVVIFVELVSESVAA